MNLTTFIQAQIVIAQERGDEDQVELCQEALAGDKDALYCLRDDFDLAQYIDQRA